MPCGASGKAWIGQLLLQLLLLLHLLLHKDH
jgi:hypothetical protein